MMTNDIRNRTYQFKIQYHDDTREWDDIPVFEESNWSGGVGAALHAISDLKANDERVRVIRYNEKGSPQGRYI